jgi:hypothetical protein
MSSPGGLHGRRAKEREEVFMRKVVLGLAGAAILVVLFFVLRPGDDDDDDQATPPPPPATGTATATTTTTRTTTTTTSTGPTQIRIVVRGGRVIGGLLRARLERGERAILIVRADVSDHVHLHGYDIMRDVSPGRPARLRFRATVPGRFEVELEDRRLQIAQIEVRP